MRRAPLTARGNGGFPRGQYRVVLVGDREGEAVFCLDTDSSTDTGMVSAGDGLHMWDACGQVGAVPLLCAWAPYRLLCYGGLYGGL